MSENWQVQELDGSSISDHASPEAADLEQARILADWHRPTRVVRTA